MSKGLLYCVLLTAALLGATDLQARPEPPRPADDDISFNRDIRPLFVRNCFGCHGDAKQVKGNVLLKTFEDATGATGYEPVLVPGDPDHSPLFKRITSEHKEMLMPPVESGKQLNAQDIANIERWIRAGAKYEKHWSYMPVQRPAVPEVADSGWVRNPIDAFVLRSLQEQGLAPSPVAEDRDLVRRLWLDLTGLAPDYDDVVEKRGISSDDALYTSLVDELLASEHFGERMAVPWLDWVKYSDEVSNHGDYLTTFYPYRNYVIRAFNDNKPFDQFTIEQLAGDLLPEPSNEQLIASAYNHLIVRVQDGVGKEAIHKYLTERVDKLGQIWLASSLECSQCHDHKFDRWSQKQYYQFSAFFNDLDRIGVWTVGVSGSSTAPRNEQDAYFKLPRLYLPTPEQKSKLADIDAQLAKLRAQLDSKESALKLDDVEQQLRREARANPDYYRWIDPAFSEAVVVDGDTVTPLEVEVARPPGGNGAIVTGDIQFVTLTDKSVPGSEYRLRFPIEQDKVSALMLRVTQQGGDSFSFNRPDSVAISEIRVALEDGSVQQPVAIASAESTDLGDMDEARLIDGDISTDWRITPRDIFNKYRYERKDDLLLKTIHNEDFVVLYLREPLVNMRGKTLQVTINYPDAASRARSINLSYTANIAASPFQKHAPGPVSSAGWMRNLRQNLYDFVRDHVFFSDFWDFTASRIFTFAATKAGVSAPVPFNDVMKSVLATIKERFAYREIFRDHVALRAPQLRELGARIRHLERQREKLWGEVERSWVSSTSTESWPVRVLKQGQISDTSGELVGPALPDFLNGPQAENLNRLDLGRWLVADDNPLTSRVIVNRLWEILMGRGLVTTTEEFGSGGEKPSHPELLDWLAAEFVDSGWDIKHMMRLIATSSAYRQSSLLTQELARRDPDNRYYARQTRFRVDAEFIQDYILKTSGLLRPGLYGEHTVHDPSLGNSDQDRRSVYLLRHNIEVQPALRAFGAKPREKSVIHRPRSITPIQALASLNQPLVMRAAEMLADELMATPGMEQAEQRLAWLYRRLLQRDPLPAERDIFQQSLGAADSDGRAFWIGQARSLLSLREATLRS